MLMIIKSGSLLIKSARQIVTSWPSIINLFFALGEFSLKLKWSRTIIHSWIVLSGPQRVSLRVIFFLAFPKSTVCWTQLLFRFRRLSLLVCSWTWNGIIAFIDSVSLSKSESSTCVFPILINHYILMVLFS